MVESKRRLSVWAFKTDLMMCEFSFSIIGGGKTAQQH